MTRITLPGVLGEIQTEVRRLKASTMPGIGTQLQQGELRAVNHHKLPRGHFKIDVLSDWMPARDLVTWLKEQSK